MKYFYKQLFIKKLPAQLPIHFIDQIKLKLQREKSELFKNV